MLSSEIWWNPSANFSARKVRFEWTEELDFLFQESKAHIISAIQQGVRIFDVTKCTCLRIDWCKTGIGYLLAQQHCNCQDSSYGCCPDGWQITLAGSRFLTESNYAPIEGKALAVVWVLDQTWFFTMGCNALLVIVDHRPLTTIFGDRRLDEIDNPGLFCLKRRTLRWQFELEYRPGRENLFTDAASRHPNRHAELASIAMSTDDILEELHVGSIGDEVEKSFAVTWIQRSSWRRLSPRDSPTLRRNCQRNLRGIAMSGSTSALSTMLCFIETELWSQMVSIRGSLIIFTQLTMECQACSPELKQLSTGQGYREIMKMPGLYAAHVTGMLPLKQNCHP